MSLAEDDLPQGKDRLALWAGLLLPPIAWFLHQRLSYMLVPWACSTGRQFTLHLVTGAMLLLVATGGWMSWSNWQRARHERPGEAGGTPPRSRFMAFGGLLSSGMFTLVILAQAIPSLVMSACEP